MAASVVPNALVQDFASISRPPSNASRAMPGAMGAYVVETSSEKASPRRLVLGSSQMIQSDDSADLRKNGLPRGI
jgi:hypothetical protein